MALEVPNFGTPDDTLMAVTVGALLAVLGGFLAARLESWISRKARERDAALLLGEIVFTFVMLMKMAIEAKAIGDPYGPITLRMLHGARREADAYERNRERLTDMRDAALRIQTHKLMVSVTMSLDAIFENTQRLAGKLPKAEAEALAGQRERSLNFVADTLPQFEGVLAQLSRLAKVSFEGHEALARA